MSLQDSLFSEDVEYDVSVFSKDKRRKRVLVFPPVNNYRRFLIHQLVQDRFAELLHTFSIGQGYDRRTVVCYKSDLIRDPKSNAADQTSDFAKKKTSLGTFETMGVEEEGRMSLGSPENIRLQRQVKSIPAREIYRPPAARKVNLNQQQQVSSESLVTQTMHHNDSCSIKNNKQKRPDRAVYVPRHRRSLETEANSLPVTADRITRDQWISSNSRKQKESCPARKSMDNERNNMETGHKLKKSYDKSSISNSTEDSNRISSSFFELTNSKLSEQVSVVSKVEEEISRLDVIDMKTKDMSMSEKQSTSETPSEFFLEKKESNESLCKSLILINMEMTSSTDLQVNNESKVLSDNHSIEKSEPCDIVMSPVTTEEQKSKEECNVNRDKTIVNNKNKRAVKQNLVSDVLIISDNPEKEKKVMKEVTVVAVTPPEKKVKKVERPKSKPAKPPSPPVKINRDECEWDSLFNDNGDCLDPTLIEELTSAVGEVMIEQPKSDYKTYSKPIEVSSDEFAHVVEIYNFPSEFKTSDLAAVFSPFKSNGFELKWVDDTHCLGVFSSPLVAAEVLASDHPFVKTRPLSEATALSRTKARRSAEFLQPYRTRPETCAALARRLVTGALGVKLATARQEREREKNILREAKEKKRLANKQREDAWEGIIPEK